MGRRTMMLVGLVGALLVASSCSSQSPSETTTTAPSPSPTSSLPTVGPSVTTTVPSASVPDVTVAIRRVDGVAEFYLEESGERFVPRGTNLVDTTIVDDRINGRVPVYGALSTVVYDSDRVRSQLRDMANLGYNVVRVMLEVCGTSGCISDEGEFLNEAYLDNAADFLSIAKEEGVHVWYSSNTLPDRSEYSRLAYEEGEADFLTPGNVSIYGDYFTDFLAELAARNAPLDNLFSFEIRNEYQYLTTFAPWDRTDGVFEAANGERYDLADVAERRRLAEEGLIHWTNTMVRKIKERFPSTLVSIGLLIPNEPIVLFSPDDPRFVYPGDLWDEGEVDFFDIHTGPGWPDIGVVEAQFGRSGQQDKPVVMGEFPIARVGYPDVDLAAREMVAWQVGSCTAGYDGWLSWHWTGDETYWPIAGTRIGEVLSPALHPDPCEPVEVEVELELLNFRAAATASRDGFDAEIDASYPAGYASDQNMDTWWSADEGPPQWIEVDLGAPSTVGSIRLPIGFVTPAGRVRIEVRTIEADGGERLVHVFDQDIEAGDVLEFVAEPPLEAVRRVRFDITEMQGWVIIHEIEILRP